MARTNHTLIRLTETFDNFQMMCELFLSSKLKLLPFNTLYHQICTKYGQMDIFMCKKYQHFIVKQKVYIFLDPPPPLPPVYVLYTQFNVDVYGRPLTLP